MDYSFAGGSLDVNATASLPQTDNGGTLQTGLGWLDNIADKWLRYQDISTRRRYDLEYTGYDQGDGYPGTRPPNTGVPSWVWGIAALGVGYAVYKAVR